MARRQRKGHGLEFRGVYNFLAFPCTLLLNCEAFPLDYFFCQQTHSNKDFYIFFFIQENDSTKQKTGRRDRWKGKAQEGTKSKLQATSNEKGNKNPGRWSTMPR